MKFDAYGVCQLEGPRQGPNSQRRAYTQMHGFQAESYLLDWFNLKLYKLHLAFSHWHEFWTQ